MTTTKSNDELVWEAPPEGRTYNTHYDEKVAEIKKSPGRWARLRLSTDSACNSGRVALKRRTDSDPRWEVIVRKVDKEKYGLFARYRTDEQMKAAKQ